MTYKVRTYSNKVFLITQNKATTEWYGFSNVKFSKMLSFDLVAEAYGMTYSRPLGENFSFALQPSNITNHYGCSINLKWAESLTKFSDL